MLRDTAFSNDYIKFYLLLDYISIIKLVCSSHSQCFIFWSGSRQLCIRSIMLYLKRENALGGKTAAVECFSKPDSLAQLCSIPTWKTDVYNASTLFSINRCSLTTQCAPYMNRKIAIKYVADICLTKRKSQHKVTTI